MSLLAGGPSGGHTSRGSARDWCFAPLDGSRQAAHLRHQNAPRELDLNSLGDARSRWINPHFIYTHGYGIVMAEANQITTNGLPVLFVKDAPPEITVPGLKLTRPELYYSEIEHDPVFVAMTRENEEIPVELSSRSGFRSAEKRGGKVVRPM